MATFPSYVPSKRNFTPGIYPQKSFRTLGGVSVKRTFGNVAYGARLELEFSNVTDAKVQAIAEHYFLQTSKNQRFNLPDSVTAGMTAGLSSIVKATSTLRWEYEAPPTVESIFPGVNVVRLALVGEIRDPKSDDV